jgi:hypothetical protein
LLLKPFELLAGEPAAADAAASTSSRPIAGSASRGCLQDAAVQCCFTNCSTLMRLLELCSLAHDRNAVACVLLAESQRAATLLPAAAASFAGACCLPGSLASGVRGRWTAATHC